VIREYFRELGTNTLDGWNRFWFTPSDAATLGAIRMMTGGMLVYTHGVWGLKLTQFFGSDGVLPRELALGMHNQSPWAWSHLYQLQTPGLLWTVHLTAMLILILFTLGCWTRVTSILSYLITVSYAHRAVGALFGLDQVNAFLAMYLAVGGSGDAYSVDAWIRGRREGRGLIRRTTSATIAQRLIQVHMCIVYLFAGLGKLQGQFWWDGTALWGAFANFEYQTLDMTWVASYPIIVNLLTQVTLAWEIAYMAIVWPRMLRPIVIALSVPLHLGIALCMGMTTFGLIMIVGNLSFVSPELIRRIFGPQAVNGTNEPGRASGSP